MRTGFFCNLKTTLKVNKIDVDKNYKITMKYLGKHTYGTAEVGECELIINSA